VAPPGFVARRGKAGNYVMGAFTADFRAGACSGSMTNGFVTDAVLIKRAVSC